MIGEREYTGQKTILQFEGCHNILPQCVMEITILQNIHPNKYSKIELYLLRDYLQVSGLSGQGNCLNVDRRLQVT